MTFGEAIRHLREQHRISVGQFAKALSVSKALIINVEIGDNNVFSGHVLETAYRVLGLDESQRAELEVLRILALGKLDLAGLDENAVRTLINLRNELLREKRS